jgi:hypothetical protein
MWSQFQHRLQGLEVELELELELLLGGKPLVRAKMGCA